MTQIDEVALEIAWAQSGIGDKTCRKIIKAYESAKAPRTISREELERAALAIHNVKRAFGGVGELSIEEFIAMGNEPPRNDWVRRHCYLEWSVAHSYAKAALATLGITVEGE